MQQLATVVVLTARQDEQPILIPQTSEALTKQLAGFKHARCRSSARSAAPDAGPEIRANEEANGTVTALGALAV